MCVTFSPLCARSENVRASESVLPTERTSRSLVHSRVDEQQNTSLHKCQAIREAHTFCSCIFSPLYILRVYAQKIRKCTTLQVTSALSICVLCKCGINIIASTVERDRKSKSSDLLDLLSKGTTRNKMQRATAYLRPLSQEVPPLTRMMRSFQGAEGEYTATITPDWMQGRCT